MEWSQLYTFSGFLQERNFLERSETEVLSRDVHMTSFVHAENLFSIKLA